MITLDQALAEAEASERAGYTTAAVVLLRRVRELEEALPKLDPDPYYEVTATMPPGYRGHVLP